MQNHLVGRITGLFFFFFLFYTNVFCTFFFVIKKSYSGTSLVVRWLRLCTSTAKGTGSIPGQGTEIPHAVWQSQKNAILEVQNLWSPIGENLCKELKQKLGKFWQCQDSERGLRTGSVAGERQTHRHTHTHTHTHLCVC